MEAMPRWAIAACAAAAQLRSVCPTIVPATQRRGVSFFLSLPTKRSPMSLLQLEQGVVYGGFSERSHRPPLLSNVVVLGGGFRTQVRSAFPRVGARAQPLRGALTNGMRPHAIALGPRRWAGLPGRLSLTPSIDAQRGELGDLTIFRWSDASGDHAVGVNVWEPLAQSVASLHAIVSRLSHQAPPPPAPTRGTVEGIPMTTTPAWMLGVCNSSPLTRPACPNRVPDAPLGSLIITIFPTPAYGPPTAIQDSIEWFYGSDLHNPHPPRFGHLKISEGNFPTAPHDGPRQPITAIRIPRTYAPAPTPISHPAWTHPHGLLIFGDCFGNHLCYRWRHGHRRYQIDLHAWYPLTHTRDVLHAIVSSTPASHELVAIVSHARARRPPSRKASGHGPHQRDQEARS
jgi:hypothetical protein